MGGQTAAAMRAAIAYCDGWMPTTRGEAFFGKLAEFRKLLVDSGRDPKTLSIGACYDPTGNLDQDRHAVARFAEAGVDRLSSWVPWESGDKVLANVEKWARLIENNYPLRVTCRRAIGRDYSLFGRRFGLCCQPQPS